MHELISLKGSKLLSRSYELPVHKKAIVIVQTEIHHAVCVTLCDSQCRFLSQKQLLKICSVNSNFLFSQVLPCTMVGARVGPSKIDFLQLYLLCCLLS